MTLGLQDSRPGRPKVSPESPSWSVTASVQSCPLSLRPPAPVHFVPMPVPQTPYWMPRRHWKSPSVIVGPGRVWSSLHRRCVAFPQTLVLSWSAAFRAVAQPAQRWALAATLSFVRLAPSVRCLALARGAIPRRGTERALGLACSACFGGLFCGLLWGVSPSTLQSATSPQAHKPQPYPLLRGTVRSCGLYPPPVIGVLCLAAVA